MPAASGGSAAYKDRLGKDQSRCQSRHSIAALSTVTLLEAAAWGAEEVAMRYPLA